MASISNDPHGLKRLLFTDAMGKRRTIRLGKVSKKAAATVCYHVEHLVAAKVTGTAPPLDTSRWLAGLDDRLIGKLARVGLVAEPARSTLKAFLDGYIASRTDGKPNTVKKWHTTRGRLIEHFGADRPLTEIGPADIDDWRRQLAATRGENTVRKHIAVAKVFFGAAKQRKLIAENPLDGQSATILANPGRMHFVTREVIKQVLDACPDAEWRLLVALARYGGLRCPSEILGLRWSDMDWEGKRFRVRSSKTEHHVGEGERYVPLFPELIEPLNDVWDAAPAGADFIITRYRQANCNLRTQLQRIIQRAGVEPWPKLFQNLRSTRQTELGDEGYPSHVVCAWLGNSERVARRHYLQVTDAHFARAVGVSEAAQKAAQSGAADTCTAIGDRAGHRQKQGKPVVLASLCSSVQTYKVAEAGVEPARELPPTGF